MEDKKAKILVVDDEPEIVDTMKHFLSTKGYSVSGALSGEEALAILEKERADLILMDMMMPGIKGAEAVRIIRDKYPLVKIMVITGYPEEGSNLARDIVLDGMFTKPVEIHEFYNKLVDVLRDDKIIPPTAQPKQGITARVLLIKAKLLFLEPSAGTYDFISFHLKARASRGENYEIEAAFNEREAADKMLQSMPDILMINMSYLDKFRHNDLIKEVIQSSCKPKEIIIYNVNDPGGLSLPELDHLTKTVQVFCVKSGLIEVKWVEI